MYVADLHIHSRFSMATSRQLTIPHLAGWAMCKGINVLGTGDFTHPAWQAELEESLEFDEESGLYRMKGAPDMPGTFQGKIQAEPPLFCLQTEISSIYKRGGKSRRVHNLVFFKRLEDVRKFSGKLAQIGNIESDGRPILGLDSRDLLELVLETSDAGVCIPAHIWTPWFSLFGSKSGFDAIEECFGDLTEHIFALETGLSSDPAMNRLVSALDKYALVSNSDAHSGANLGREANLFSGSPSYDGLFSSLRRAAKREPVTGRDEYFCGTLEIYPEEGKYHLDGHRNCHVVMTPEESAAHGNICPVCGKPLTIGVLHRVWELADRKEQPVLANEPEVFPIIPLAAVFAQLGGVSSQSKAAKGLYSRCLEGLGSELAVLAQLPVDRIKEYDSFLAEAVRRIRTGELGLKGGYDGEFGTIELFSAEEMKEIAPAYAALCGRKRRTSVQVLPVQTEKAESPDAAESRSTKAQGIKDREKMHAPAGSFLEERDRRRKERNADSSCIRLSEEQEKACAHMGEPLLVLAGPGSGKTRVLAERMVRLLEKGTDPASVLALTFSRKAAREMEERVQGRLPAVSLPFCGTFHAFAWKMLKAEHPDAVLLSDQQSSALLEKAMAETMPMSGKKDRRRLAELFWLRREQCLGNAGSPEEMAAAERYAALKKEGGRPVFDFADLLEQLTAALESGAISPSYGHVLVDEVQDLSLLQIRMLKALLPQEGTGFFGIGDPEQSVYAFRGAAPDIAAQLSKLWPGLKVQGLSISYRSSQKVLDAAGHAAGTDREGPRMKAARTLSAELTGYEAPDQGLEERWVAKQIAHLLPRTSHTLLDEQAGSHGHALEGELLPSDIAVLVRLKAQIPSLARALSRQGIPVQVPSRVLFWQDETMGRILGWLGMQLGQGQSFGLAPYAGVQKNAVSPEELVPRIKQEKLADEAFFQSDAWTQLVHAYAQAGNWEQLFQEICWQQEVDCLQSKAQSVRILTMHAAKGLEFRAVFIPGFNDGIMPLDRMLLRGEGTGMSREEEAEERRLLYVAMTRASEAVFVSWTPKRHLYGRELELKPSRFWADMAGCFSAKRLVSCVRKSFVQGMLLEPPAKK